MKYTSILSIFVLAAMLFACEGKKATSTATKTPEKTEESKELIPGILAKDFALKKLAEGYNFLEGPIWDFTNNRLLFSEVGGNKLHQWSEEKGVEVFLDPSYYAGGNAFDSQGNILSCQGGARQVARISPDGKTEVLTKDFEGKKFNSPNDIVEKSDGTIWFTDPDYGLLAAFGEKAKEHRELDKFHVFRYDPATKQTVSVYADLSKPNGLVFSQDESKLYVGNSNEGDRKLVVFDVTADNQLQNMEKLADIESKTWGIDGLKMDKNGNLYAACGDGVNVLSPDGKLLGKIPTDFEVTNICFGKSDKKTLFLTGHEALYAVELLTSGK